MRFLILCAGFLSATGFSTGLLAGTPPMPTATVVPVAQRAKPDSIEELQKKRIAVLKEIVDITEKSFKSGQVSFDRVGSARLDLLQAQLDASRTKEERLRLLEEMVKHAEEMEAAVKRLVEAGQAGRVEALKSTAFVLQTRIALEKVKVAKDP
jgi:outer membrane protein TolC